MDDLTPNPINFTLDPEAAPAAPAAAPDPVPVASVEPQASTAKP